jgi:hypothetical protein
MKINGTDTVLQLNDNTYNFPQFFRLKGIMYEVGMTEGFKLAFNNQYNLDYEDINGNAAPRFFNIDNPSTQVAIHSFIPIDLYINEVYFGSSSGNNYTKVWLIVDFTDTINK